MAAQQGRWSRRWRRRASSSPPRAEVEGECRWPAGPERKGRRWDGERGAPRRPQRAREEPDGSSWSPESQTGSGGYSWRDSNLEGERRSWPSPGRGEEDWRAPVRGPQEAKRESRRGSFEPPRKRARSPPGGEGWRGSLSPPKGRAWTSPISQRQPSSLSSSPPAQRKHSSSRSGKGDPPRYPHSPPVSRDRWGGPKRKARRRSATRHEGPSTTWDSESPPPPIRRVAEGRSRGLEEPGGVGGSSHRSQGDPGWETRQAYLENRRKPGGGSRERWRRSSFQNLPQGEGDQGSHPSRGGKRDLDLTRPSGDYQGRQEWKEDSEESGRFSPQSWVSPKKRRRRSDDREPRGTEEESWARDRGHERCQHPTQDQDDRASLPEILEDWLPRDGQEGKESSQRGLSGRPAKCPAPTVGWVPCEEVVNYWKQCQSLLPKTMKSHFLSTCPRPTIPDGSTQILQLNQSLLDSLNSRQVLKVSLATRHSFASQVELMDMLVPAMALYEMAESAIENGQAVDLLDVQELARRLISYAGSLNQSLTMQRCSQVLGVIAPQLRWMTNQMSSQNAGSLLFAEEKVKLIEDFYRSSDWEPETQDYTSLELWHRRFAHADSKAILKLHKHNLGVTIKVNPGDIERIDRCIVCLADKGKKPSFPLKMVINSTRVLDLIHCELCGPFSVPSTGQHRYALIFVDDFSRYCVTYLLKKSHEAHEYFKRYLAMLSRFQDVGGPKAFQFNSAGESVSRRMKRFSDQQGIPHKSGIKENPGQSRTAAREVVSLLEMTRCMLADAHLPNQFWGSAIMAATYLLNRLPIIGCKKTPFQVWQGSMPSIRHIRVFGSLVYTRGTPHYTAPYIFTGYNICQKSYKVMNLETGQFSRKWSVYVDEHKRADRWLDGLAAIEGHDAKPLLATIGTMQPESGDDTEDESNTLGDGDGDEEPDADKPEEASGPLSTLEQDIGLSEPLPRNEPATWEDIEDMSADKAQKWHSVAREEIEALRQNAMWTLTKLPPGKRAVRCKWVFKVKPGAEGQVESYTAQLVLQKPGEDVDAIVTPDVKLSTTRMLLSISASKQMQVKHLEVKTAHLHGEATEELYMEQPPGFVDQKHPNFVCKLKKDLCRLKEASWAWNEKLKKILSQQRFKQDEADRSLYRRSRNGHLMFIFACANNLVVASQHEEDYEEIMGLLNEAAEVKELGDATGYLGSLTERAVDASSLLK